MTLKTIFRACQGKYAVTHFENESQPLVVGIHPRKEASTRKNGKSDKMK